MAAAPARAFWCDHMPADRPLKKSVRHALSRSVRQEQYQEDVYVLIKRERGRVTGEGKGYHR